MALMQARVLSIAITRLMLPHHLVDSNNPVSAKTWVRKSLNFFQSLPQVNWIAQNSFVSSVVQGVGCRSYSR